MVRDAKLATLWMLALSATSAVHAGEGFGGLGGKTIVTLTRKNPPVVMLPATTVGVQPNVTSERALSERLATLVETQLLAGDKRLSAGGSAAQVLIRVGVLESAGTREWQSRTYTVTKRGGAQATVVKRELVVHHKLTATYSAIHSGTRASIDSTSITLPYAATFDEGHGAPQLDEMASEALDQAASRIVGRLTFTRDALQVLLPEGSLNSLKGLAQAGAWSRYLEALEGLPARSQPRDDAYRQFALGIAHEALAYAAEDPQVALNYLEQAALLYDKAITMKPDEKYFLKGYSGDWLTGVARRSGLARGAPAEAAAPLARVQESIARYQKIKDLNETLTNSAAKAAEAPTDAKRERANGLDDTSVAALDNQAVLRMVKAGLAEDVITTAIRTSARNDFDVSSTGLITLSEGGVAAALLREMQAAARRAATRQGRGALKATSNRPPQ